jgi:hypothetical protein
MSLLGLAGGTAVLAAGWVALLAGSASALLLARAFYVLYVKRRGNAFSVVVTWSAAVLLVALWTWRLVLS